MSKRSDEKEKFARLLDEGRISRAVYDARMARMKSPGKASYQRHQDARFAKLPEKLAARGIVMDVSEWTPGKNGGGNTIEDRRRYGAMGGKVTATASPAKAAALERLHASLRGARRNEPGLNKRQLHALLGELSALLRKHQDRRKTGITLGTAAAACHVSDRTIRRWLRGEDWPDAVSVAALKAWIAKMGGA